MTCSSCAPSYCCLSAVEAASDADAPQALITASFCDKNIAKKMLLACQDEMLDPSDNEKSSARDY
jgi:hypothetical protein